MLQGNPVRAINLLLGMGNYSEARAIHQQTPLARRSSSFEHLAFSHVFGDVEAIRRKGKVLDHNLLSLVHGKKICVIGPGRGSELGQHADLADSLILRFEEARRLPQFQRRVDIGWEDSNPSRKDPKFVGNQKVLLVNYPEFMERFSGKIPHVVGQERFEGLGGYGVPLGAMRAALNLLPYEPSEIYMTGIDFFLSESQYEQSYGSADQEDRLFHHWSLMHGHDLVANLNLGKALVDSGKVTGDEKFLRAINTSADKAAQTYDYIFWRRLRTCISQTNPPPKFQ